MAYFSSLFSSSPISSSPEALFFTPLSHRARSTPPEQSPVSPTLGRSPSRSVEDEIGTPGLDENGEEFTGFSDLENIDSDVRFTVNTPFKDTQGQPQQFESEATAYIWLQACAKAEGFAVKMGRHKKRRKTSTVYHRRFNCVCGGPKHNSKLSSPQKKRKGRGKNTGCQWHCIIIEEGGIWQGHHPGHLSTVHNHPRSFGATYPAQRRCQRQTLPGVQDRILADAKVKTITRKETFIAVSQQFPGLEIKLNDIFNIQTKKQNEVDNSLPTIQAMIQSMGEAFSFHYSVDERQQLDSMVFIEKASLKLLQRWPYSIILDATYKTNKFGMYLIDIVGVTSTGRTYIIAQAFLSAEGEDDYAFILEWLKGVYINLGLEMPLTITTDRALGLIKALKAIFPTSYHLLCTVHINRDVLAWCKKHWQEELLANTGGNPVLFDSDEDLPHDPTRTFSTTNTTENSLISTEEREEYLQTREMKFLLKWNAVIHATQLTGERGYEKAWQDLRLYYLAENPEIVSYLEDTWIGPFKKAFCQAWTNLVRHFGCTTTNRSEGSHRGVKRKLPQRRLHIRTVIDIMQANLEVSNKEHLDNVETDRTSVGNYFAKPVLFKVKHRVSIYAIRKLEEHLAFFKENHLSALPRCKGSFTRIWGVPCAHTVYTKIEAVECLEIEDFHPKWHLGRPQDFPLINPALLLRDPVVVRDGKNKGKTSKTGRIWSRFEHVNQDGVIMTTPRRQKAAIPGQKTSSSPRKQACTIPYWKYSRNGKGLPAPTPEEAIRITEARSGQPRDEFGFRVASNYLDLEGRCRIDNDPIALHDEHGWTHITACGNAFTDPFDDEVHPEYEEELYTYFGDVLMTPTEKRLQTEMLQQWSECEANPRYIYTWKRPQGQPQLDTVVNSIEQEIEQDPPTSPRVLKSALKRQHEPEPELEEVNSEVHETQGAYRGTRSRSRSVAPSRKRVRFSEV
jgi:hypothetical protein